LFDIFSLSEERKISDLKFLFKLAWDFIDCPEILGSFHFEVPLCRTKPTTTFYIFTQRTNNALSSSVNRIISIAAEIKIELYSLNSIE
jgi:hypothetical protein